jgi:hypothetical protein
MQTSSYTCEGQEHMISDRLHVLIFEKLPVALTCGIVTLITCTVGTYTSLHRFPRGPQYCFYVATRTRCLQIHSLARAGTAKVLSVMESN